MNFNNYLFQQPFWSVSGDNYEEHIVDSDNISLFYTFVSNQSTKNTLLVVPDLNIDIIFRCGPANAVAYYCGPVQHSRTHKIVNFEKNETYFGIRFKAGTSICRMIDILEQEVALENICGSTNICDQIGECQTFKERIAIFMRYYTDMNFRTLQGKHSDMIQAALENLYLTKGNCNIKQLSSDMFYSVRQFNQIFQDEVGLSPKAIAKTLRFQNLLNELSNCDKTLLNIALDLGYYDEPHMIKDFRSFTLMSPKKYQSMLYPAFIA